MGVGGFTLRESQLMTPLGLHFERFSAHEAFGGFALKDSQLMDSLGLHFEKFPAHEASGASLREIPSS